MDQQSLENLVREVLGDEYRALAVRRYTLTEDIREGKATIVCLIEGATEGKGRAVEGVGVGLIDALFSGFKRTLSGDFSSLNHIHFCGFIIEGDFSQTSNASKTDVIGNVRVEVENSSGRRFQFSSASKSMSASSVNVVVKAVEHFVNAELAVSRVYDWIEDANRRHRPDLAEQYTRRLSELVQNSSYSESLERKKAKAGI
ncbi:MAG: alpha-isopropylmalate synthase regulatory domain-containing protein [Myxococcota bacterium]